MASNPPPQPSRAKKGTLLAIVGIAAATMLFKAVPAEESGRKVEVSFQVDGTATLKHVSGPLYLKAYLDSVGVATACDGLTRYKGRPITVKDQFTEAQCSTMLEEELVATSSDVMRCTPGLSLTIPRRDNVRFAAVSMAYNIGSPSWCGSTARKLVDAGRIGPACDAFLSWDKGTFPAPRPGKACTRKKDGKWLCPIGGLTARRQRERTACMKDAA